MSIDKALEALFKETIKGLRDKIKGGEATASDFKNAIELLKNNGITVDVTDPKNPMAGLLEDLPFQDDDAIVGH